MKIKEAWKLIQEKRQKRREQKQEEILNQIKKERMEASRIVAEMWRKEQEREIRKEQEQKKKLQHIMTMPTLGEMEDLVKELGVEAPRFEDFIKTFELPGAPAYTLEQIDAMYAALLCNILKNKGLLVSDWQQEPEKGKE